MRKRPDKVNLEKSFINEAVADKADETYEKERLDHFSLKKKWPLTEAKISPVLESGSQLRKPINLPLKEYEWNSIDHHTKFLGVQKAEWIRYAIFKLMYEEQMYFKNRQT